MQYCVSRALTEGKVSLEHFDGAAHADPTIESLLARVQSSPYTGPFYNESDRFDAVVKVTLANGQVLEAKVDAPLGRTVQEPIPAEALNAKFRDCAARVLDARTADAVCQKIWAVEKLGAVQDLTALLEVSETAAGGDRLQMRVAPATLTA